MYQDKGLDKSDQLISQLTVPTEWKERNYERAGLRGVQMQNDIRKKKKV